MSLTMLPPLTDFFALLGLGLVLCAWQSRLLRSLHMRPSVRGWLLAGVFALLWIPVGAAHIPLLAYVRGISSDLSITFVVLACLALWRGFGDGPFADQYKREIRAVFISVAIAAVFLYPLALGWGNWDAYRPGWGSFGMLAGVLLAGLLALGLGLRLLPLLLAVAVLAWTAGLMESGNLWDYLFDPWLAVASIFQVLKMAFIGFYWLVGPVKRRPAADKTAVTDASAT